MEESKGRARGRQKTSDQQIALEAKRVRGMDQDPKDQQIIPSLRDIAMGLISWSSLMCDVVEHNPKVANRKERTSCIQSCSVPHLVPFN